MRYFKNVDSGHAWLWDGRSLWSLSVYGGIEELMEKNARVVETDAAGNPLGKYRYFRDTGISSVEWRTQGNLWELRNVGIGAWIETTFDPVDKSPTAYECDEWGSRLGVKGFTLPEGTKIIPCGSPEAVAADNATPSPAPMSEEDRFRWQFAGQAASAMVVNGTHGQRNEWIASSAVALTDAVIAALKKPKATENGGGK